MKIIVINKNGTIIGVEPYNPANNSGRNARKQAAAEIIGARIGLAAPTLSGRIVIDDLGNSWGPIVTHADLQVGMVEVGFGKWGFPE
uniref:Uncharacterized protein n=1 Tax=viral metagenome TaxID=1070528 RepID=A0A6M3IZX3_9ZZZZ